MITITSAVPASTKSNQPFVIPATAWAMVETVAKAEFGAEITFTLWHGSHYCGVRFPYPFYEVEATIDDLNQAEQFIRRIDRIIDDVLAYYWDSA